MQSEAADEGPERGHDEERTKGSDRHMSGVQHQDVQDRRLKLLCTNDRIIIYGSGRYAFCAPSKIVFLKNS
jgi:hypothetical protein